MSTAFHDIYDPPPAPSAEIPPRPEPITYTTSDLKCLIGMGIVLFALTAVAWSFDAFLGALTMIGGALVIVESWFTALGFMHRQPEETPKRRWVIVLAALVPWVFGLGAAALLMLGLFYMTDWVL